MQRTHLVSLGVTLAGATVFAHAALAWGEPKNQPPFTRQVAAQRSVETAARPAPIDVPGEPKNQLPFTATVAQNTVAGDWFERYAAAHPYGRNLNAATPSPIAGEPKNELPFTRLATRTVPAPDWFERYAAAHPYGTDLAVSASATPISPPGGFHWGAALIGAAATASLALLGAAVFAVSRARRREQLRHAIST